MTARGYQPVVTEAPLSGSAGPATQAMEPEYATTDFAEPTRRSPSASGEPRSMPQIWMPFLAFLPTTALSILLLISDTRQWTVQGQLYTTIDSNRAVVQVVVQVIANVLGFLNLFIVCTLMQYLAHLRLSNHGMSLYTLRFWTGMLSKQLISPIPVHLLAMLVLFIIASYVPSAIWAGALTPLTVVVNQTAVIALPSYANTDMLAWNWGQRLGLNSTRTSRGVFTYNVGEQFMGRLINSAATSTTVDGSPRVHSKLDDTGFSYFGRSYGVGVSVGLVDDDLRLNSLLTGYAYQEPGYSATVSCSYNATSEYRLTCGGSSGGWQICSAVGYLPNSAGSREWADYPAWSSSTIVAIGVASNPQSPGRILGIASGSDYAALNNMQCEWKFAATMFNVSVNVAGRNITVAPVATEGVSDIEPGGLLTFLANWQFPLVTSDQTSLYSSLVGSSIQRNIENFNISQAAAGNASLSSDDITLGGLERSLEAMMDDTLSGYAGAQLMVANVSRTTEAQLAVKAMKFGQRVWIVMVFALNMGMLLLAAFEAIRTRGWTGLPTFSFVDPALLIIGTKNGAEPREVDLEQEMIGRYRIMHQHGALLLHASGKGWKDNKQI